MIDFNTPTLLWGLLGLAIPILIHFWHQKQGKRLDWAATQWLSEKNLQQARGIRLDNIWLLILRLAIVLLQKGSGIEECLTQYLLHLRDL